MSTAAESGQSGDALGSHALHYALQTMTERCKILEERLMLVENENVKLRVKYNSEIYLRTDSSPYKSDVDKLHEKIAEITRQKSQLVLHMQMVAIENKHLWTRLTKIIKDNHSLGYQLTKINDVLNQHTPTPKLVNSSIIRSKTFTQNSPNSKLLPKIDSNDSDISLEEISLKLMNSFMEGKNELEEQYDQMVKLHSENDENGCLDTGAVGFAYMAETEEELVPSITQCVEQFDQMRDEIIKQKNQLNLILKNVQTNNKVKNECLKCKANKNKATTSTNTEEEIGANYLTKWGTPVATTSDNYEKPSKSQSLSKEECPMCGKVLLTTLNDFRLHVEQHFLTDENDTFVLDSNYEIVTRLGDF